MSLPPDPLDRLLEQWKQHTPPPPPHLAAEVWRRISVDENSPQVATGWWRQWDAVFARPSFAAAFVAACMLLGLFLAEVRRSHLQVAANTQLMQSYLRLVDPLLDTTTTQTSGAGSAPTS